MTTYKNLLCAIPGCQEKAITLSEHCWLHTQDKEFYRKKILDFIINSNTEDLFLRKINLDHADLREASLKSADLSQASLSGANLHGCDLSSTNLLGANLSNSDLSNANLTNADLTKADITNARLWYANLRDSKLSEAILKDADLWQAKLYNTRIWNTDLSNTKHLTSESFYIKNGLFEKYKLYESDPSVAKESYRELKKYFSDVGRYDDASWASFEEKNMDTKFMLKNMNIRYIPSLIMGLLCGYGEKSRRVIISSLFILFSYAGIYKLLNAITSNAPIREVVNFWECLYFSIIIFTTVGLGDFTPKPNILFRLLVSSEAFLGAFMIGLFVFTLARKYSAR